MFPPEPNTLSKMLFWFIIILLIVIIVFGICSAREVLSAVQWGG